MNKVFFPIQSRAGNISLLAVSALLTLFVVSVHSLMVRLWPAWTQMMPLPVLAALTAFVALEAQVTGRTMRSDHLNWFSNEGIRYVLVEWGGLALASRFAPYPALGSAAFLQDIRRWTASPGYFFDASYVTTLVLVGLTWTLTRLFDADLERLQSKETDLRWESLAKLEVDRHSARQAMGKRIFALGSVAAFCTAFAGNLESSIYLPLPPRVRPAIWALVAYFVIALFLLGQAHFALLRGRWLWERTPVQADMPRRWTLAALGLLGIAGLLAFALPTHYSLPLLDILWGMALLVSQAVSYLFFALFLLFSLLTLPISWLMQWFNGQPQQGEPKVNFTPPPPPTGPFDQTPAPWTGMPWWEVARAVLFWVLLLVIFGAALRQFILQNHAVWARARAWPWVDGLLTAFERLTDFLRGAGKTLGAAAIASRDSLWQLVRRRMPDGRRLASLRARSPRERVFSYYRAFLKGMSDIGQARRPGQTPYQFAAQVHRELPESKQAVNELTESFVQARYAPAIDERTLLTRALTAWRKLRSALRALRR